MMSSVSTHLCSSVMPPSAMRMRRWPSNWNGFVTTPTVRMPSSLAQRATTGAAPLPVPPPMPAVTNTMWAPARWSRISSIASSAAARPTSGCEPAPSPSVTATPIWMMRSALDMVSAWASVFATTKSTPCSPLVIMLLTALPPAPPVPNTVIRGFSSRTSGIFRLMLMFASSYAEVTAGSGRSATARWACRIESSEALAKPLADPCDIAAPCRRVPRSSRFEMFEMCRLRIDQQSRRNGECRSLRFVGQSGNAERSPDPHLPAEYLRCELRKAGKLARSAGEHHASAWLGPKRRGCQAIAHHLQDLFDARLDDARDLRARDEMRCLALVIVHRRHRNHVAFVGSAREHAAIERLDALGIGDACIEAAGEIHGHVPAAEREAVGMDETPAGKHRDGRGTGADLDQRGAEIELVVGQRRERRYIGARHHRLDVEMTALDREHQIAGGRDVRGHDVHVDAELAREHAAGIADAAGMVEHVADRQRMQHGASRPRGVAAAGGQHAGDVALADGRAGNLDRGGDELARRAAGRNRDDDRLELHPG